MSQNNSSRKPGLKALLLFSTFLLVFSPVRIHAQAAFYIPRCTSPPVIDGEMEDSWDEADDWTINHIYGGSIRDEMDFSGSWRSMWDDSKLYFQFRVHDDALYNLGAGAEKFWIHDCAEIFIDLLNDKDLVGTDDAADDDNYQYRFIWNLDEEPIYEVPPSDGLLSVSRTLLEGADTLGYNIEVEIPWTTLIGKHPFGEVEIGKQVGAEVKIADLDSPSVPAGVWAPDAELLWNNSTGNDLKITAMFGTLQLVYTLKDDLLPPSNISDLDGEATGSSSARLRWTAPVDANTGRVAGYEMAVGTDSGEVAIWGAVEKIQIPGMPQPPGSGENYQHQTLDAGTSYFFAVRSHDGLGNSSQISNVTEIRTFDPDTSAPGPITDLAIDSSSSFMADLTWTAPGDDENMGTATGYDIRYHHTKLTNDNWESATRVEGAPAPLAAGHKQVFRIHGLQAEKTYFFGIKSLDEAPNISGISNIVELYTPSFTYRVKHPVDQMIGTNSFIDAPLENMKAVGFIREYHPWSFTEIEDDVFEYNRWNGFWDFDKYYTKLKELGITVCPALWSSPDWLEPNAANKPLGDDEDAEDPFSYQEMAQLMYQYAARYGSASVPHEKLLLNEGQVKKSGMGVLSYFEDWNEQDRDWEGRDAHFTAAEYAAMASANVDGHGGSLGEGFGLKTADPSSRFVMGGLYILGTAYISDMYNWFLENRPDHRWPIDVINMHHYAHTASENGICPEKDRYKERVQEVIDWRNEYAPENEVWITEFGYDTNDESPNRINPFAGFSQQEIQAQWLVRTYLLLSSVGVDRAAQFMIRDVDPNPQPRWSDCGLTLSASEGSVPKTSWYYVYTLKNVLKDFYFDQVIAESNSAHVYRFVHEMGDRYLYALWSPTGDGSTLEYRLKIPANPTSLRKIELADGSITGKRESMDSASDMISMEIGERPVFLLANYGVPDGLQSVKNLVKGIVSPNPCKESIQITLPGELLNQDSKITIYSITGQELEKLQAKVFGQQLSMDLSALKSGVYILTVETGNQIFTDRIVKQ